MRTFWIILAIIVIIVVIILLSKRSKKKVKYKFIKPYSATVTVGGALGIMTKTFNVGDTFEGIIEDNKVKIRIAPHSVINEGPPSNISYQEHLLVPTEYLKLI